MLSRRWHSTLLVLALAAAGGPAGAQQKAAPSAVRTAIERGLAQWVAAAERGDAAAMAALYTEDAMILGAGQPPITGRAAIEKGFEQALPVLREPRFTTEEVETSGPLAYERGHYERTLVAPGADPIHDRGKYMIVWKRSGDGVWRLHRGMLISDVLPAAPVRAAAGDSVFAVVNHVKPEMRAEWERLAESLFIGGWRKLGETDPAYASVVRGVRMLVSASPGQDGSYTYLVLVDPHRPGVSYDGRAAIAATHSPEEIPDLIRAWQATLAKPQETGWFIQK